LLTIRALLATVLLGTLGLPTALHGQSLSDLAKKTQEDRAKAKQEQVKSDDTKKTDKASAAKVYSNNDLVDVPPPAAAPADTNTEPVATDTPQKVATAEPATDEAYWRRRMTTLRGNLARDNAACEPLAAKVRELDSIYASSVFYVDGKAMVNRASAAVIETKLVDAKSEQQQCLAKVTLDRAAIDTVLEEARRLGVLPGWLR
jgi:hypothetical protein